MPVAVIAVAGVVTAAYGIYSGERSAAEAKKAMNKKPPDPANYYEKVKIISYGYVENYFKKGELY